jgi:threonine dehydrogenase-like Zn-dependent dehydrogenase
MSKILGAVMPGPGLPIELREFHQPELESNSALLSVSLSEVCGTDIHFHSGRLAGVPYPIIPGHVSVGHLSKIKGVLQDIDGNHLREGDPVTFLDVHGTCGACWYCSVAKSTTRCPQRKVYGVTYGVRDGLAGGWAEALYLKPGTRCLKLQESNMELFMAGGCSLPTARHALERAEVSLGDSVLVLGSGPVGISIIICALLQGARRVFCIGAPAGRLLVAQSTGACATRNFSEHSESELIEWVQHLTAGRGADITIEATGDPHAVVQAMRFTRDAGRVVIVGQYTDAGEVLFNPHLDLNKKHLEIRGCWGCDFSHTYRAVQLIDDVATAGRWKDIPLKHYALQEAALALEDAAKGVAAKPIINPRLQAPGQKTSRPSERATSN